MPVLFTDLNYGAHLCARDHSASAYMTPWLSRPVLQQKLIAIQRGGQFSIECVFERIRRSK